DDTALLLSGSMEAGTTVQLYDGTTLLGNAITSGTTWSYTATVVDGVTYAFHAMAIDVAGNRGDTALFAVTGDTTAPAVALTTVTDDAGSKVGALFAGMSTDDTALLLSGSVESGATVRVYDGALLLGSAISSGTTWSYTATVADGVTYAFNAIATDGAGNSSRPTARFAVTGDTTAPTVTLTSITDDVGSVTGALVTEAGTDDTALLLSGSAESGATVNIYNGTALLGMATSSGTTWSYTATVADGVTYAFNAVATDSVGNSSATSHFVVTGDTTAPAVFLTTATDDVGSSTGTLASGGSTDDTALLLTGRMESGATVKVYNGTTLLGTATGGGTAWSYTATLVDGTAYAFNVTATDAVGNTSAATRSFVVTGDSTAPAVTLTTVTDDVGSVTGSLTSGGSTDDAALLLSGSTESGATVTVYNGTALLGTATTSGTTWSYLATVAHGITYAFNAIATDGAGNSSSTSTFMVTGDIAAPTVTLATVTDDVGSVTGALLSGASTDDTALLLSGSVESGSTVTIYNGATLLGSATTSGTTWSYTATVADGVTYAFNAIATDSVGNSSSTSRFTVTGDTTAPVVTLATVTDNAGSVTGTLTSGETTDDTALLLAGSTESGATVKVYDGTTLLGTATTSDTAWSYTATVANGTLYAFNAIATDAAGNSSSATSRFSVTGDTTAPTVALSSVTDDVGSVTGTLTSGGSTDDTALLLVGSTESGATVKVYNGTTLLGTATTSGTTWSYTATVADGVTYAFNAIATDSAGNSGSATGSFTVTGDRTAPAVTLSSVTDDVGSVTGPLTSGSSTDDTALLLSGSVESGSTVKIYNGTTLLGSATTSGGTWSYTATVANGTTYAFNAIATDSVGNSSSATSS
ncbi:MAG: hemagglutinin, partial [Magnetococcales bacterium]|nr:hemagglutinin [Magnetococcales bacterium]